MRDANRTRQCVFITRFVLCLSILGVTLVLTGAAVQASAFAPAQPLGEMLNPDGALNLTTGFHGALDAKGWQLVSGPNEPPRFAPQTAPLAIPSNQDWASNFSLRGVSDDVNDIAVDNSGNVYAGGSFTVAGGVAANYVAKWKASSWSALSNGTNAPVSALATDASGNVYAGGSFSSAADRQSFGSLPDAFPDPNAPEVSTNYVAKWNGTTWSSIGSGMNGPVLALAVDGTGKVYAGGFFTTAGGTTVYGIAKWNGSAWSAMGHGFDSPVLGLAVDSSNNVYAGGIFSLACDATCAPATSTTVNHIAKWNGSAWSAIGNGFTAQVNALALDSSNNIYAGGMFGGLCGAGPGCPPGPMVRGIAKWNGIAWSAMDHGFNNTVFTLAVDSSNNVYAGGGFTLACDTFLCNPATSTKVNYVAKWNAGAWSALSGGTDGAVMALARDSSGNVYAGGSFTRAGSPSASFIAKWNGASSSWSALGSGDALSGSVRASARDSSNNVYAGGSFTTAGGVSANGIAKWNGSAWSAMGNGFSGATLALAVDSSNNVYAAGAFLTLCDPGPGCPSGTTMNRIAKWNGSSWSAMGNGFNDTVFALAVDRNNNVYAAGAFVTLCGAGPGCPLGITVNHIAKWNGIAWSAVGNGFNGAVYSLAADSSNNVFAGGAFDAVCAAGPGCPPGAIAFYIAEWNGASWLKLAGGLNDLVYALAVDRSDNVYAGGSFTQSAAFLLLRRIGRWDGTAWSGLGNGFDDTVYALAVDSGNNVFAGGRFTRLCDASCNSATSPTANHVAMWDGNGWSALGSGTNGPVGGLTARNKTLFVGGSFTLAGGKVSGNVGSVVTGQTYLPLTVR